MLHREIIAVCSEIHTKHISTVRGQKAKFVIVRSSGKAPTALQAGRSWVRFPMVSSDFFH